VGGPHGVAAHLAQHAEAERLQPVGQGRSYAGMVLMIEGALNLEGPAVEEESLL
jgi:hypothetical protein